MISVISVFEDVRKDSVVTPQNGNVTIGAFNRISRRAELRAIDYLTGDLEGVKPPFPYLDQKNRDWISDFIETEAKMIKDGVFPKPKNYYRWDSFNSLEPNTTKCEDQDKVEAIRRPIELLESSQFDYRTGTFIEENRPENGAYIAKLEKDFIVEPKFILNARLVYVRYPVFAEIKSRTNQTYNREEPDPDHSRDYEWPEAARELLIYFITDLMANKTTNSSTKQFNEATNKSPIK